jgi:beta-glucosidase
MEKNTPLYDPSLPVEERAKWLVSQLTPEEKFGCFSVGIRIPRLGIAASTCGGEGAHGVQARAGQREAYPPTPTTSFPQPIGMAATFDRELIRRAGDVTGKESRAFANAVGKGGNGRLGPTIDLCRDPRWGRNEEGYGEDPYLTGKMASAYIAGMQDEHNYDGSPLAPGERGDRVRTGAVLKHFYANNQEWRRCYDNFDVSDKVKYDYELEPYRYCAQEGHAEGVMTSYNEINHIPAMLNHEVQDILKDRWGVRYAMTDGGDFLQTVDFHHYFETHAETLAEAVRAGVDAMLDDPFAVADAAREAYGRGLVTEEEMDKSILCTVTELIRQGAFDPEDPYADLDMADVGTDEARRISLAMSRESNVLLKNEGGFLPFSRDDDIALIGHVGASWYMDWYGGKPTYAVTLKAGLEKRMRREIPYDSGLNLVRFKAGDKYLGASRSPMDPEAAELILVDRAEDAVLLEQTNWGCGSNFLYAPAYRRFLTVGEDGKISLASDDPFAWYVYDSFTIGTAEAVRTPNPRNANSVELSRYWNDEEGEVRLYCFGNRNVYLEDGRLKTDPLVRLQAGSGTKEGGNQESAWAGSRREASVLTVEMVSSGVERARELAKKAKKVIVALGCNPVVNAKEEIDRSTIDMIPLQEKLAEAVYEANPNTAVVLLTNYPYAVNWLQDHVPAILTNVTGSQDLGNGLAAAIFGEASPAGRLPMTWYKSDGDLPPLEDYDLINHPRTYRYFQKPVLYPFGYGLSYTRFEYGPLQAEKCAGGALRVSVEVRNVGGVPGDEVAQLYIRRLSPSKTVHPLRRLVGFQRLHDLAPGEAARAEFTVEPGDLEIYVEEAGRKLVEPGAYFLYAGGSCLDERSGAEVEL